MGRKKKKEEESTIYHTPFGSTTIPPYPEIDLSSYIPYTYETETTSLSDDIRRYITTTYPGTSITYTGSATGEQQTIYYPSTHWEPFATTTTLDYEDFMRKIGKEEEAKVNVISKKSVDSDEHIVCCKDMIDLSMERVLTTLSAVKGRLMFEIAPIHIKEIQCKMTPMVKRHIIDASKKLRMYGKKSPIIPSFDEYGNRLPDEIEIGDSRGITIQIVDPESYGVAYFELKAIEFHNPYLAEDYLPF